MSLSINRFDVQTCKLIQMLPEVEKTVENERCSSSSTTTTASTASSIGRNSDDDEDEENEEVQSVFNGGPLDMMESLEEVLPIRRGISNFYNGKSKSFTSLVDASSSSSPNSMKEVAKPENAYTRRRRNLLAFNQSWEKNHRTSPYRTTTGISKRSIGTSRSTYALAVAATSSSESISNTSEDSSSSPHSTSPPAATLPPLHPNTIVPSAWRSFSVVDLRQCGRTDAYYLPRHQRS